MLDIKYGESYLTKYLGLQRTLKKIFNVFTLVISVGGILSWKYFENYVWVAFILIAILQLFTLVENEIIRTDKEIEDIATLRMLYTKYFNKLEKLWTEYKSERIPEIEASDTFFELRNSDWETIEELDTKLNIKQYKRLMKKSEIETNNFIKKHLNHG